MTTFQTLKKIAAEKDRQYRRLRSMTLTQWTQLSRQLGTPHMNDAAGILAKRAVLGR